MSFCITEQKYSPIEIERFIIGQARFAVGPILINKYQTVIQK
jgi:hypothetical protein